MEFIINAITDELRTCLENVEKLKNFDVESYHKTKLRISTLMKIRKQVENLLAKTS